MSILVGWWYKTRFSLLHIQTFVEKKIIEIGLELVIFNKKLLSSKNSTFFTSEKNTSNLKQKNSFHSSIVVLTKTNRSSEVVVGNIHRPILKLHTNPQHKWQLSDVYSFLVFSWTHEDKGTPLKQRFTFTGLIQ